MQRQATDVFYAYVAQEWDNDSSLESLTYIGNYLLTAKNPYASSYYNYLYLVYKTQARNNYTYNGKTFNEVNDIYWYIRFNNLRINADGKVEVDITRYEKASGRVDIDSGIDAGWWSTKSWYYDGYSTLDELYKDTVMKNMDLYNHEDSISDDVIIEIVEQEIETIADGGYVLNNSDKVIRDFLLDLIHVAFFSISLFVVIAC